MLGLVFRFSEPGSRRDAQKNRGQKKLKVAPNAARKTDADDCHLETRACQRKAMILLRKGRSGAEFCTVQPWFDTVLREILELSLIAHRLTSGCLSGSSPWRRSSGG
jgi:hypothetical protein